MLAKRELLTLAASTGTYDALGTITTLPAAATLYVRFPAGLEYEKLEWIVRCDKDWAYQLFRAFQFDVGDPLSITLSSLANTETFSVNGLVYTGATSTTTWSTRTCSIATSMTLCAALFAKAITGGRLITHTTADASDDTVAVTGIDGVVYTYTGKASASLADREFDADSGVAATIATSLAAGINHKGYFTCASSIAGDHVVVGSITYTGKTSTQNLTTHYYSVDTSDDACGASLAACINADTATHGFTASNSSGTVTLTATTAAAAAATVTGHATTVVYTPAYGLPGVVATTGVAELLIGWETPTGGTPPTVTTSSAARAAVTTVGDTYCYATAASGVITVKWRPAYLDLTTDPVEKPRVCSGVTGTATSHAAFTNNQLATLYSDGAEVAHADTAVTVANNTSGGTILQHTINGAPEGYLAVTNKDAAAAATIRVLGTRIPWED